MPEPFGCAVNHPTITLWTDFSPDRAAAELSRIAGLGAQWARVLLPWRVFQPDREQVPEGRLVDFESLLDAAARLNLRVLPVLFARAPGELPGVPEWVIDPFSGRERRPRDFYRERDLVRAQQLQIQVLADGFGRHEALAGWDLGRETSRLLPPPDPEAARGWLLRLLEALKKHDERHPATFTLSQSDLEEDRGIRPAQLGAELDFVSIQAFPTDAGWARSPDDAEMPGFLAHLVRALTGKVVWVAEVGLPTGGDSGTGAPPGLVRRDEEGGRFYREALESVRLAGAQGVAAWCLDDFPESYLGPPHERLYGLFRAEGSPKPGAESFSRFASARPDRVDAPVPARMDEPAFYRDPPGQLRAAFERFLHPQSESAEA